MRNYAPHLCSDLVRLFSGLQQDELPHLVELHEERQRWASGLAAGLRDQSKLMRYATTCSYNGCEDSRLRSQETALLGDALACLSAAAASMVGVLLLLGRESQTPKVT